MTLIPGTAGRFEVTVNGELLFSKASEGRFPELREITDKLRDLV